PRLVRCRISVKGPAAAWEGKVKLQAAGRTLNVALTGKPTTVAKESPKVVDKIAMSAANREITPEEQSLLNKVIGKSEAPAKAEEKKAEKPVTASKKPSLGKD